jgi:hypothetical protein
MTNLEKIFRIHKEFKELYDADVMIDVSNNYIQVSEQKFAEYVPTGTEITAEKHGTGIHLHAVINGLRFTTVVN